MKGRRNLKDYLQAWEYIQQGLTQKEAGEKMGVGYQTIGTKVRFINYWLKNKRVLKRVRDVAAKYNK